MQKNNKVIAVIVTYNRKELLKECIEALINQKYKKCSILVIDNNSTDGTKDYIQSFIDEEKIMYENTGENLGGAGGFAFGIKKAYLMGCDYIWVMDDDCIVHDNTLEEFMKADKKLNGNYGFLSSKVLWKNGEICKMNIQRKTLLKNVRDFETDIQQVTMASFVSLLIKTSVIKKLGLPLKEFFIWTDDWEYTRRISRKYKCYLVNESVVTHKSKNNMGADIVNDSKDRLDRYKYIYRNDVYLYRREGIKGLIYIFARNLYHMVRIIFSKTKNKKDRIDLIVKATKEGEKFNPPIEYVNNNLVEYTYLK